MVGSGTAQGKYAWQSGAIRNRRYDSEPGGSEIVECHLDASLQRAVDDLLLASFLSCWTQHAAMRRCLCGHPDAVNSDVTLAGTSLPGDVEGTGYAGTSTLR